MSDWYFIQRIIKDGYSVSESDKGYNYYGKNQLVNILYNGLGDLGHITAILRKLSKARFSFDLLSM